MGRELTDTEIAAFLKLVAEHTRARSVTADFFLPPHVGLLDEVAASQHQLIVGRRGVGKSMLLLNVVTHAREVGDLVVYLDLESLRGLPYPDVLIRLLAEMANALAQQLRGEGRFRTWRVRKRLGNLKRELDLLLPVPQQEIRTVLREAGEHQDRRRGIRFSIGRSKRDLSGQMTLSHQKRKESGSQQVGRAEFVATKMEGLRAAVPEYRTLLREAVELLSSNRALLLLDDFYFVPQSNQPEVLGYLHQVVKGLEIWLKIGGVEHRLNPFREGDPPVGLQRYQDAGLIRLDATLKEFHHTKRFLEGILSKLLQSIGADLDDLVTETGRERLVLASGGVPRDYLNLTAAALRSASRRPADTTNRPRNRITAEDVNDVAPELLDQKEQELTLDASSEHVERLRARFNDLVHFCVNEQKRNVFIVEATKLREEEWGRDILALAELRFIHPVGNLTVKSSNPKYTGRRYEAFVLDLSAYAGTRVRKIEMIPFWTTDGAQQIRGATLVYVPAGDGARPQSDLEVAENDGVQLELELSD